MRVSASREVLRRAKWTKGAFRSSYVGQQATVVRVQAAQALVRWLAATPVLGAEVSIEPPPEMQRPSRLIELFEHHARSCWRLGEHAILSPQEYEEYVVTEKNERPSGNLEPFFARKQGESKKLSTVDKCVEVVACHTRVDVIWQDGSVEMDGAATSYAPAKHVDGYYEFWPQDFIVGKSLNGQAAPVGVVQSVDHDQRLCVVIWRSDGAREVLPVYEIAPHPDFNFKVGDVVLKLPITQSEHEVVQRRVVQILDPYASLATLRSRHTSISSHLDLCSQCQFLPRFVHADLVRFVDHVAARLSCIFSEKTRMAVLSWRVLVQLIVRFG